MIKRLLALAGGFAFLVPASADAAVTTQSFFGCVKLQFSALNDEFRLDRAVGGKSLSVEFEADALSDVGEVATLDLFTCTGSTSNTCDPFMFDTDGDGVGDTNTLDGSTVGKRGIQGAKPAGFIKVVLSTGPGAGDTPQALICVR